MSTLTGYNTNFGFLGIPGDVAGSYENSKVVILPVPFEQTIKFGNSTDQGPSAIVDASHHLAFYDIETKSEPCDVGIFTDTPIQELSPIALLASVEKKVRQHRENDKFVITIGGEHSITSGAIKGSISEEDESISVIQFDAHPDLQEDAGTTVNRDCSAMSPIIKMSSVKNLTAIGIRSVDPSELSALEKNHTYFAKDIHNRIDWIEKMISNLEKKVYITFDLDCFDVTLVTSTRSPEPGGLAWYHVLHILKEIFKHREVIGCDVTELCPNIIQRSSDFIAAKLIYKMIAYKFFGDQK